MSNTLLSNDLDIGILIDRPKLLKTRMLIQAGSGGGKSFVVRKLAEMNAGKLQQLILDPEGEFVSLREKFDFLLVSKEGDIPISIRYAEAIAHKLLQTGVSAILDLYELKPAERRIFVQRFGDALLNAPKELWHPVLLYVDEAHIFAPESQKSESLETIIGLCTRGRKRGICTILATQRLSKLHKDAAAECQNKLIGLATMDIDRFRAAEELGWDKKGSHVLRNLEPGKFYGFGPAISREPVEFKVKPVVTKHMEAGGQQMTSIPTPKAIAKILDELKTIPQEAEQDLTTRQQLQAEVTRLRSELTRLGKTVTAPTNGKSDHKDVQRQVDQAVNQTRKELTATYTAHVQQLHTGFKAQAAVLRKLKAQVKNMQDCAAIITEALADIEFAVNTPALPVPSPSAANGSLTPNQKWASQSPAPTPSRGKNGRSPAIKGHKVDLPIGETKILTACAQYPNGLDRNQFTVLTGFKRSTRDAYIQRLREKRLVEISDGRVKPTDEGLETLGPDFEPLPTGVELQQFWLNTLPEGQRKILMLLIGAYPNGVSRETLSEESGFKRSTRDAYIQRMRTKEIVQLETGGLVKAAENLF